MIKQISLTQGSIIILRIKYNKDIAIEIVCFKSYFYAIEKCIISFYLLVQAKKKPSKEKVKVKKEKTEVITDSPKKRKKKEEEPQEVWKW